MYKQYKILFTITNITVLILAISLIVFQIATMRSIKRLKSQLNEQCYQTYNNRND